MTQFSIDSKAFEAQLNRLIESADFSKAVLEGMKVVKEESQANAPVDTGELRDSHRLEQLEENEALLIIEAPHALFVELGTSKMAAQPYLRPAIDHNLRRIAKQMADEIGIEIRKKV